VARWLARRLAPYGADVVLSPALGGLIIGHEVAEALGVPFRFCERQDGEMVLRRGFTVAAAERVIIVEDVVTTGRSTREVMALATAAGARVAATASILDRSGGSHGLQVPFVSLLRLDLPVAEPASCDLCARGVAIEKPGSRPAVTGR
jgi:orotate phosphoribosyltransferase